MGAWIEIQMTVKEALDAVSLPSWERGLKLRVFMGHFDYVSSLPSWERGLKSTIILS